MTVPASRRTRFRCRSCYHTPSEYKSDKVFVLPPVFQNLVSRIPPNLLLRGRNSTLGTSRNIRNHSWSEDETLFFLRWSPRGHHLTGLGWDHVHLWGVIPVLVLVVLAKKLLGHLSTITNPGHTICGSNTLPRFKPNIKLPSWFSLICRLDPDLGPKDYECPKKYTRETMLYNNLLKISISHKDF